MPTTRNKDRLIALSGSFWIGLKELRIFAAYSPGQWRCFVTFLALFTNLGKSCLDFDVNKFLRILQTTKRNMPVAWRGLKYRGTVSGTVRNL